VGRCSFTTMLLQILVRHLNSALSAWRYWQGLEGIYPPPHQHIEYANGTILCRAALHLLDMSMTPRADCFLAETCFVAITAKLLHWQPHIENQDKSSLARHWAVVGIWWPPLRNTPQRSLPRDWRVSGGGLETYWSQNHIFTFGVSHDRQGAFDPLLDWIGRVMIKIEIVTNTIVVPFRQALIRWLG
jgi:hypothetical protein